MSESVLIAVLVSAAFYFVGGIPFGVIFGKALKGVDIRKTGSGNIGTSNAFRALGPVGGSLVLFCDTAKGALAVLAAGWLVPDPAVVNIAGIAAGTCAILGHNYSPFLGFKGGKGIATSFGVFLALNWIIAMICFALWAVVVASTKISSVASMSAAVALPVCYFIFDQDVSLKVYSVVVAILALYMHRSNIRRLIDGTELKMSTKETKNVTGQDEGEKGEDKAKDNG